MRYCCALCQAVVAASRFARHLNDCHQWSVEDYYLLHVLKTLKTFRCQAAGCVRRVPFKSMAAGYNRYCSTACRTRSRKKQQ